MTTSPITTRTYARGATIKPGHESRFRRSLEAHRSMTQRLRDLREQEMDPVTAFCIGLFLGAVVMVGVVSATLLLSRML